MKIPEATPARRSLVFLFVAALALLLRNDVGFWVALGLSNLWDAVDYLRPLAPPLVIISTVDSSPRSAP